MKNKWKDAQKIFHNNLLNNFFYLGIIVLTQRIISYSTNIITFIIAILFGVFLIISYKSKSLVKKYMFAIGAVVAFILSIKFTDIEFEVLLMFIFYLPIITAFLLPDVYSTIGFGVILSWAIWGFIGEDIPTKTIIGIMIIMINASISYTIISYLYRKCKNTKVQLIQMTEKLKQLSIIDELTGLYNRRYMDIQLSKEWRLCKDQSRTLSIILVDIDLFKNFNDFYGHQKGDECLVKIAHSLNKTISKWSDWVARFGGEEFIVILSKTNESEANIIAGNLRAEIENLKIPHNTSNVSKYITVSIGVCTVRTDQFSEVNDVISLANKALYKAKKEGRNRVCYTLANK